MLRVSNPICDLMFFIFSGSDEKFREKHYYQLLDHYYNELCNSLKRLGVDPEETYTRKDFDYELKEVGKLILIHSVVLRQVERTRFDYHSTSKTPYTAHC